LFGGELAKSQGGGPRYAYRTKPARKYRSGGKWYRYQSAVPSIRRLAERSGYPFTSPTQCQIGVPNITFFTWPVVYTDL
jgi:hypothetical protein